MLRLIQLMWLQYSLSYSQLSEFLHQPQVHLCLAVANKRLLQSLPCACCGIEQPRMDVLLEACYIIGNKEKVFTVRVMRQWNRLPRDVTDAPSLETLKVRLDEALSI